MDQCKCDIPVNVIGNGLDKQSSDSGQGYLHFHLH